MGTPLQQIEESLQKKEVGTSFDLTGLVAQYFNWTCVVFVLCGPEERGVPVVLTAGESLDDT